MMVRAAIAIENKPWADDQPRQLNDYAKHLGKQYKHFRLIYLTPNGEDPSEYSIKREKREKLEKEGKLASASIRKWANGWLKRAEDEVKSRTSALVCVRFPQGANRKPSGAGRGRRATRETGRASLCNDTSRLSRHITRSMYARHYRIMTYQQAIQLARDTLKPLCDTKGVGLGVCKIRRQATVYDFHESSQMASERARCFSNNSP